MGMAETVHLEVVILEMVVEGEDMDLERMDHLEGEDIIVQVEDLGIWMVVHINLEAEDLEYGIMEILLQRMEVVEHSDLAIMENLVFVSFNIGHNSSSRDESFGTHLSFSYFSLILTIYYICRKELE